MDISFSFSFSSFHRLFNSVLLCIGLLLVCGFIGCQCKDVKCIENKRFYRDPDRAAHKIWTNDECSKYYLCLDEEVFEFRCSNGLLFDVSRQICDFKVNVDNCDITAEAEVPKPLLDEADCPSGELGCADGTCLPNEYFCDGSTDCADGSDEISCHLTQYYLNVSKQCDPENCQLPNCFCSENGTEIPGNLDRMKVPQMIVLTFDDAINEENWDFYMNLFQDKRRNPNGCGIKGTFFVSHQYTNYQLVQELWNDGHEIAVHSITHRGPEDWWSNNATIEDWFDEMVGQANILNRFGKIRMESVRGMRVPFLRVGWNRQFLMMKEFGFVYDSSIIAPFTDVPLWPYTLDYKMPHACLEVGQNCPTRSYSNVWEMVINQLETIETNCPTIEACSSHLSGADIYKILHHNFIRHYTTNRAPFGLHLHTSWFKNTEYLNAFTKFVDEILESPDVWFVTNWETIQWIRNPKPLKQLHDYEAWNNCRRKRFDNTELACDLPNVCKLYSRIHQQERMLYTCAECPQQYPWIRNEFGMN